MNEVVEWSGWGFVGALAQIVSLIAIVFAALEISARSARFPEGVWDVSVYGRIQEGDRTFDIINVTNSGSGNVRLMQIITVGCTLQIRSDYRILWNHSAGTGMDLLFESSDFDQAWVHFVWVAPVDRRFIYAAWFPLSDTAETYIQWTASQDRALMSHWYNVPLRGRRPRPVGPGGVSGSSVRLSGRQKHDLRGLETISAIAIEKSGGIGHAPNRERPSPLIQDAASAA